MLCSLALAVALQDKFPYDPTTLVPKSEIMVVGSFHFTSSTTDLISPSIEGIMEERRQNEIIQMVNSLAKFKPTKICVESPRSSDVVQKRYEEYLAGEYELAANETDQIGLRLAKMLGHKSIYPVDYKSDMDFGPTMGLAAASGKQGYIDSIMGEVGKFVQAVFAPESSDKTSVSEIFSIMNSPEADEKSHSIYMRFLMIGEKDQHPGADLLGGWYMRNVKIATNLFRLIEKPGERILLIIGMGHAKYIRDIVRDMPNVESVSPLPYLQKG